MVYKGRVENGHIVLQDPISLPEGTIVSVVVPEPRDQLDDDENIPSLYERLRPIIGLAKDMPSDAARNVDHYLYGHPKE